MKNEIEKRQREDDNKENQISQQSLEAAQNGTDESAENDEPTLANGVDSAPAKIVAC